MAHWSCHCWSCHCHCHCHWSCHLCHTFHSCHTVHAKVSRGIRQKWDLSQMRHIFHICACCHIYSKKNLPFKKIILDNFWPAFDSFLIYLIDVWYNKAYTVTPSTLGGARTLACSHYLSTNAIDTVLPFCDFLYNKFLYNKCTFYGVWNTRHIRCIVCDCEMMPQIIWAGLFVFVFVFSFVFVFVFVFHILYTVHQCAGPAMAKWWLPISDHANPSAEPFYPNYPSLSSHYQCFHVIMKEWPDYIRDQTEEPNFATVSTVSIVQKYPKRLLIQFGPIFTKLNPTWYLIWEIDWFSAEQNGLGHLKQFWVTWFSKRKWGDQLASPQGRSTQNWEN